MKKTIIALGLVSTALVLGNTFAANQPAQAVEGTFKGTLACGDCEGIETSLKLNADNTYTQTSKYLTSKEGQNTFVDTGSFKVENGIVTLNDEQKTSLKIDGNKAYLLAEGKQIQGEMAPYYTLEKSTQVAKSEKKQDTLAKVAGSKLNSKIVAKLKTLPERKNLAILNNNSTIEGTYQGTLACGDCEGIDTTLKLTAGKYVLKSVYLNDNKDTFEDKGSYTQNGNIITLAGDVEQKFRIENGKLVLVGDENIPEMEQFYTLTK